jgi:hypothetical protein
MKKKLSTIWIVLLIALLAVSPVYAGGTISFKGSVGASWPLHSEGDLYGLGGYSEGVYITLTGTGNVLNVTCTTPSGSNQAPGQNPGKITVTGTQNVGSKDITKKGTAGVELQATETDVTIQVCPNGNWRASYDIDWQTATIEVFNKATNELLLTQNYTCFPIGGGHYSCTLN